MIKKIKTRIKEKIISTLDSDYIRKSKQNPQYVFIQNINRDPSMTGQKRAIMSYMTNPFDLNFDIESCFHTNQIECIQILNILIEMNFSIDICHCLDDMETDKIVNKKYDLIFGLGDLFHELCKLNKNSIKILYCAEAHPNFLRKKEKERLDYYLERKGVVEKSRRTNTYYKEKYFNYVNNIIYKGNGFNKKSFLNIPNIENVLPISPAPFLNMNYIYHAKNHLETQNSFIWFGSLGAIHKGLDLLVDIFTKNKNLNLFICGLDKSEEYLFSKLPPNIKNIGFVDVNSDKYLQLINRCSFVVMPSCCEGMSSGVITSMNHGLIPLISRECGVDLLDEDLYLNDFRTDYLENKILKYSKMGLEKLQSINDLIFKETRNKYSINHFKKQMTDNIEICLNYIENQELTQTLK
jgi:hypothetical protein